MNCKFAELLDQLRKLGWRVQPASRRRRLCDDIGKRYPWLPGEFRDMAEEMSLICSPDETAWILTEADFAGRSGSAFVWNECEQQSLESAGSDQEMKTAIVEFWDNHLPVLFATKSGYAYFALAKDDLAVVCGEEPEYEETTPIAPSLTAFLQMIVDRDPRLARVL